MADPVDITISVLGKLEVRIGRHRVQLNGTTQRAFVAVLAASGSLVPVQVLTGLWGREVPATYRQQLHKAVHGVRALLGAEVITTEDGGYALNPQVCGTDVAEFDRLFGQARLHRADGDPAKAAEAFEEALSLWRGPALDAMPDVPLVHSLAVTLEEYRVQCHEEWCETEFELGEHAAVVDSLIALFHAHPRRERAAWLLMTALHELERPYEALEVYQHFAATGISPSLRLKQLNETITQVCQPPVPATLPMDIRSFVGRADALDGLDELLRTETVTGQLAIAFVTGAPGVGKTALAIRWAHQARQWFPDGQLYLNLRGFDGGTPTTSGQALRALLRMLGVEQVPDNLTDQVSVYRTLLAERRVLVLLDNAVSEEQVRPLLPASAGCAVLVTSRRDLRGLVALNDALRIHLDVLTESEAHTLVHQMLGDRTSDLAAVDALARLCGRLPLALRVAAANVSVRTEPVADLVREFAGDDRLARLGIDGDEIVTTAFDISYRSLPAQAARLFRLLGLVPHPEFTVVAASALLGDDAEEALEILEDGNLVERHVGDRYRMHDLLHLHARGLVEDAERSPALLRLHEHYVHTADAALDLLAPQMTRMSREETSVAVLSFADKASAQSWLHEEQQNLLAATTGSALTWQLVDALRRHLWLTGQNSLAAAHARSGLAAAADDPRGQGAMHQAIGTSLMATDVATAADHLRRSAEFFGAANERTARAFALANMASCLTALGRSAEAGTALRTVEQIADNPAMRANALLGLAILHAATDGPRAALRFHDEEHRCRVEAGQREWPLASHVRMIEATMQVGELDRCSSAIDTLRRLATDTGATRWQVHALAATAELASVTGRTAAAVRHVDEAAELDLETSTEAYTLTPKITLGQAHLHTGDARAAVAVLEPALADARSYSRQTAEAVINVELARAHLVGGDRVEAARLARIALTFAREHDELVQRGRALTTLAALGETSCAEEALEIQRTTGHLLGEAEALRLLGFDAEAGEIFARFTGNAAHAPALVIATEACAFCGPLRTV